MAIEYKSFDINDYEFEKIREIIYKNIGIKLTNDKKLLVISRLGKRLRKLGFKNFTEYINFVREEKNKEEFIEMLNAITTNKTEFFRENHHFEFLKNVAFPFILKQNKNISERKIRIWSSACSTGEEPYTIAMKVRDFFSIYPGYDIKILASDIDTNCIKKAQEGIYNQEAIANVPNNFLKRFFKKGTGENEGLYQVKDILKEMITYRQINLLNEKYPINTKFDIIFIRNVIIYFEKNDQMKLFDRLYNYLKDDGFLFLGHSETLFGISNKFKFLKNTIYQKI